MLGTGSMPAVFTHAVRYIGFVWFSREKALPKISQNYPTCFLMLSSYVMHYSLTSESIEKIRNTVESGYYDTGYNDKPPIAT